MEFFSLDKKLKINNPSNKDIIFRCKNIIDIITFLKEYSETKNNSLKKEIMAMDLSPEEMKRKYKLDSYFFIRNDKVILRKFTRENLIKLIKASILNYKIEDTIKIISWNINGLRSFVKQGGEYLLLNSDIICFQEIKINQDMSYFLDYYKYYSFSEKKGYAGVSIFTKIKPISIKVGIGNEEFDRVGRCLTLEFKNFYLVNSYVLNSGSKLENLKKRAEWDKLFFSYLGKLRQIKKLLICGDLNVAHENIDIDYPKYINRAGCTIQERKSFDSFLKGEKLTDIYRYFYPKERKFSYISYLRKKNRGLRIDYFLSSFTNEIHHLIMNDNIYYSDHVPLILFLKKDLFS